MDNLIRDAYHIFRHGCAVDRGSRTAPTGWRPAGLGTVTRAHAPGLDTVAFEVLCKRGRVKILEAKTDVIHVVPFAAGRGAAGAAEFAVDRDQVHE